jgi:hypothetical protein
MEANQDSRKVGKTREQKYLGAATSAALRPGKNRTYPEGIK